MLGIDGSNGCLSSSRICSKWLHSHDDDPKGFDKKSLNGRKITETVSSSLLVPSFRTRWERQMKMKMKIPTLNK